MTLKRLICNMLGKWIDMERLWIDFPGGNDFPWMGFISSLPEWPNWPEWPQWMNLSGSITFCLASGNEWIDLSDDKLPLAFISLSFSLSHSSPRMIDFSCGYCCQLSCRHALTAYASQPLNGNHYSRLQHQNDKFSNEQNLFNSIHEQKPSSYGIPLTRKSLYSREKSHFSN